jgi:SAM-dependent methyltransferase
MGMLFFPSDAIWCCHVLEHQRNVGAFLEKCYRDLRLGGWLAITVPPMKPEIVGGHLTLWNAGLLLYNLILAGFDCREASVKTYDYNVSVIVRKSPAFIPELKMDFGDIEALAHCFPVPVCNSFDGNIGSVNW